MNEPHNRTSDTKKHNFLKFYSEETPATKWAKLPSVGPCVANKHCPIILGFTKSGNMHEKTFQDGTQNIGRFMMIPY